MAHHEITNDNRQALEISQRAIQALNKLSIPPLPQHYEVWFSHLEKKNNSLSSEIEQKLKSGTPPNPDFLQRVYDRHLTKSSDTEQLNEIAEKILEEAKSLAKITGAIGESTNEFQVDLDAASSNFDEDTAKPHDVNLIMTALASAARDAAKRNEELEEELNEASGKIASLQSSVKAISMDANTDFLTKLNNRRFFDQTFERLTEGAIETEEPLCLVISDIDHFKKFNDKWGHKVGDQVLKLVSTVLRDNVKGQDLIARYGGEEFAIALPNTSLIDAESLVNNIRQAVSKKRLQNKLTGASLGNITMSFGIALYDKNVSIEEIFTRSDIALYQAKEKGRDRVTLWTPEMSAMGQTAS